MANQTTIGELSINLQLKLEGLEKGLETARKRLQELEKQNEQVQNSNKQVDASFIAMSAGIIASLAKIKSAVDEGVNQYNTYVNSMQALSKTAKATNNSMADVKDAIEDVNELKLMDEADVTSATKNLLTYGFTVDQTKDMLLVLQDAAVGNRQANYTLSEAVRVTTEGIRMENSVLSDAAGVQKNISKMYEEHAKSLNKTTDALTQAEKAQAVYNGIMDEASMFTGSAKEMADGYQGVQAQLNATNIEFSRTVGESMVPALTQLNSLQLTITKGLTEFISNNKSATSGTVVFTATLLGTIAVLTAIRKAWTAYTAAAKVAKMSTEAFTASLISNPITLAALAIATVVAAIATYNTAHAEHQEMLQKTSELQERYNSLLQETFEYTQDNISAIQQDKANVDAQIEAYNKLEQTKKKVNEQNKEMSMFESFFTGARKMTEETRKVEKEYENLQKENGNYGDSLEELEEKQKQYTKCLEEANAVEKITKGLDTETVKNKQKEAAQLKVNAQTMQGYLDTVKAGQTSTTEYQEAVKQLAKAYPEAANAEGILIEQAQNQIDNAALKAESEWKSAQDQINAQIAILNAALNSEAVQKQVAQNLGIAQDELNAKLQSTLNLYNSMAQMEASEVPNITPISVSTPKKTKASGSYSNKALDNYKKEIEHKKALDQLSLQQEISMYQTALKKYAKTQDEKRELTEKIYSLQKEFQEKEYSNYTAFVEHKKALDQKSLEEEINDYEWAYHHLAETTEQKRELEEKLYDLRKELAQKEKDLLDKKTTEYERYIQDQKNLRGAEYDPKEQETDLNKIIALHRNYLNQIMQDERLSLDERKELYQEELDTIRDYEQQKRDLRVQSVNDTVSQLASAITKQIEEVEEADKKAIEENIKIVEEWKNARIKAINEEYNARLTAIQKELDLLDKSEEEKSRAEEDAEYERKRTRLEQLVEFEHDATTKANYQKELDKLIAEYQKTLDARALQDKKDALQEQQDLLKEEQDSKVQAIEDEADRQKEAYETQLDKLEEYYNKQKDMAQETAEKMLLNVEQNQNQIIKLLNSYGDAYELTGQSLGEKLAQGINNGLADKIQNVIQKLQDTIDANIERKLQDWTAGGYKYAGETNKAQTTNVNVVQQNYIQQNPEMPSETYRKLSNVSQSLAAELAGA